MVQRSNSYSSKKLVSILCCLAGIMISKVPNEVHSIANIIESISVSSNVIPSTALIHLSVSSNCKGVTDVTPAIGVHVVVLHAPHLSSTVFKGETFRCYTVMGEYIGNLKI